MAEVQTIQSLVDALAAAAEQEQLVVVEYYASWCTGCRALYPLMVQLAQNRPDIRFLLVDGDENKVGGVGCGCSCICSNWVGRPVLSVERRTG